MDKIQIFYIFGEIIYEMRR